MSNHTKVESKQHELFIGNIYSTNSGKELFIYAGRTNITTAKTNVIISKFTAKTKFSVLKRFNQKYVRSMDYVCLFERFSSVSSISTYTVRMCTVYLHVYMSGSAYPACQRMCLCMWILSTHIYGRRHTTSNLVFLFSFLQQLLCINTLPLTHHLSIVVPSS